MVVRLFWDIWKFCFNMIANFPSVTEDKGERENWDCDKMVVRLFWEIY